MNNLKTLFCGSLLLFSSYFFAQIPILNYSINPFGQAEIEVASDEIHYYVLHVRHNLTGDFHATALFLGKNGTTTLTEALAAYPLENYKVTEHLRSAAADTDADGFDDLTEIAGFPQKSPLNSAISIDLSDGVAFLPDQAAFEKLSFKDAPNFQIPELQGLEVVKFYVLDKNLDYPQLYFINQKHASHTDFANAIGIAGNPTLMTGLIVFYPNLVAANGNLGVYRFNFQPHNIHAFPFVQKVAELLAANMPFLKNNLCYYPYPQTSLPLYFQEKTAFDNSRVCLLFDDDIYGKVDYLAFNLAESYGFLRNMPLNEVPNSRDLVIYESLPNTLPRVGGIITTVSQTPLSHINLRAIQDKLPNAFVRNALQKPEINALLGKYVYFKAAQDTFVLREATQKEVDDFYESRRPTAPLEPIRDLSQTKIKPLDQISFKESASFGAKCANVATMRTFNFPENTIPDGFGVPFYFYDEFMKFNGFYAQAEDMLNAPDFQTDFLVQQTKLTAFRTKIKAAAMPAWMLTELQEMQQKMPENTPIRCRSSTNNEDLPGFSGAGLYDSRTHYPNEGHISKTIKQIYASIWNYRAFDERAFYRVNHFKAAMGILVHPSFENEQVNGVGVSIDPIYQSENTFYLNTQIGENLVTNPNALSIPEEILLNSSGNGFAVMQPSNQVPADSLVFKKPYFPEMRDFLATIHAKFQVLYQAENAPDFAMEIEFKIDDLGQLIIKQARPWVGFWANIAPPIAMDSTEINVFPNPFSDYLKINAQKESNLVVKIFSTDAKLILEKKIVFETISTEISTTFLPSGLYFLEILDNKKRVFRAVLVRK
jgi:Pyruvate phosphate dikinase, AMP/ATP-binding domain/Secretion system C-terminal sorting domain